MEKFIIASDIHGSAYWCEKLLQVMREENAKLILLGDLLYHGPRNPFPDGYDPQKVFTMLNAEKENILCVRGNCDSEVDQMVLEFPIRADYAQVYVNAHTLFLTHGHLFNKEILPPLKKGDLLLNGHFHTPANEILENGVHYLNCGSVALPKEGTPHSYILYDHGTFYFKDLETDGIFDCLSL